jgi:hypothetical protein
MIKEIVTDINANQHVNNIKHDFPYSSLKSYNITVFSQTLYSLSENDNFSLF